GITRTREGRSRSYLNAKNLPFGDIEYFLRGPTEPVGRVILMTLLLAQAAVEEFPEMFLLAGQTGRSSVKISEGVRLRPPGSHKTPYGNNGGNSKSSENEDGPLGDGTARRPYLGCRQSLFLCFQLFPARRTVGRLPFSLSSRCDPARTPRAFQF